MLMAALTEHVQNSELGRIGTGIAIITPILLGEITNKRLKLLA
jgi:hypothetical protein